MSPLAMLLGSILFGTTVFVIAQNPGPAIQHVKRIPNTANPELVYWFISPIEMKDRTYVRDLDLIAASGTFDFMFLTQREGADFYDYPTMHPVFKDLVARAHAKGIKVGLQLWTDDKRVPEDQTQGVVVEKELTLDAAGQADYTAESKGVRLVVNSPFDDRGCLRSEVLGTYAFKNTGDGEYSPGSLIDITDRTHAISSTACSIVLHIQASAKLAGYTAYIMTAHYHRYPDMFSKFMQDSFINLDSAEFDPSFMQPFVLNPKEYLGECIGR
jgi:hypothetical protein